MLNLRQRCSSSTGRGFRVDAPVDALPDHENAGRALCQLFANHYGIETVKPRFFNSYGPGQIPGQYRNVIPNFIYWALKDKALPITGTGEETRDFTYVGDIVEGLLHAGYDEACVGQEFNLASGSETRILDLANMIDEITGNRARIRFRERRKWDTKPRLLAAIDKARELSGYEPSTSLETGLKNTVAWFTENWDRIEAEARFVPGASAAVRHPREGMATSKRSS